nr:hypothetical protein [Henriciella algicola]
MTTDLLAVEITDFLHSSAIGSEPIGDDSPRRTVPLHRFSEKPQGPCFIASFRDLAFQHVALMVESPSKIVGLSADLHQDLVEVPLPLTDFPHIVRTANADLAGKHRAQAINPEPHALVADINSALMEQVFDIPK